VIVVSDGEKAHMDVSGGDREGERKRFAVDVSKGLDDIKTGMSFVSRDEPGGCPLIGQVVSGMEATRARSAASTWNGRRPEPTLSARGVRVGDRE
jgi:hypothetical protein